MRVGLVNHSPQFFIKNGSVLWTDVNKQIAIIVSQFCKICPFSAIFRN